MEVKTASAESWLLLPSMYVFNYKGSFGLIGLLGGIVRVNQKEMGLILSKVFEWFEALNLLQFSYNTSSIWFD